MANLGPTDRAALAHWVEYGQPSTREWGSLTATRPSKDHPKPFVKPKSEPWHVPLTASQWSRLTKGFAPTCMEEKWIVFCSEPSPQNTDSSDTHLVTMHFCRSWTGKQIVQLDIHVTPVTSPQHEETIEIVRLTYETEQDIVHNNDAKQAKKTVLTVCNWSMEVKIEPRPDDGL